VVYDRVQRVCERKLNATIFAHTAKQPRLSCLDGVSTWPIWQMTPGPNVTRTAAAAAPEPLRSVTSSCAGAHRPREAGVASAQLVVMQASRGL
jgi:hypothetical protein